MNQILEMQDLPSVQDGEAAEAFVSTLSIEAPCPGWPSTFTWGNC
ncbi:hypothetical protein ACFV27_43420 [Streptomyces antimycoticus]|uniref:Lantibiotic n=1 Tax=Streptomyces antimycoticus TaxID=68175 RepID=A0ABD5JNR4_9ACTN|nr:MULTISPECIES: hypothetical protein [Streptomyces]MEE4589705.1 hypothetical protein [Streptomyces sp. DSM 41602]WJE00813.1 hypothetical protein QR300_35375 [Streptomyces antimycoticus]WTA80424.1 hypothetical protein OG751_11005 [Streptomyces antimycoticus]WTB09386.1 hypothetical protein OG546_37555 [Streptomyces antimycoticus]